MGSSLTKSSYLDGFKCNKFLWISKFAPSKIAPPSAFDQNLMDDGNAVGTLVHQLYPNGIEIPKSIVNRDERIALTKELMSNGTDAIFEATFFADNIEIRVDALLKSKDGYEIRELKAIKFKSNILNDKKFQKHINDVSIQYYVLNKLGYNITNSYVMTIDGEYVRGDNLNAQELFKEVLVTNEVLDLQDSIPVIVKDLNEILSDKENEPNTDIDKYCHKDSQKCGAKKYCWQEQRNIPDYSIFEIFNLTDKSLNLYRDNIVDIKDIPENVGKTPIQEFYIDHWINKSTYINYAEIDKFISELDFPLFHLDFESYNPAIPKYKNSRPYQQIPFQYSIHIEHNENEYEHREFLGDPKVDPREELICQLISDIEGQSSVIVYSSFEIDRIEELARDFPKYQDDLLAIIPRIKDFQDLFIKRHYYSYKLKKKYSIKKVMQLLVPNMESRYIDLKNAGKVSNGEEAILACKELYTEEDPNRIKQIRRELLDYCELDTLATLESLRAIRKINLMNN